MARSGQLAFDLADVLTRRLRHTFEAVLLDTRVTEMRAEGSVVQAKLLGPDLKESIKKYQGHKLLQQVLSPSSEINEKFQNYQLFLDNGRVVTGVITKEDDKAYHVVANLLTPDAVTVVAKETVEEKVASKVSPMPEGLANVLSKQEILDLLAFLQKGDYELPKHLQHHHGHEHKHE